jgi:predicted nucleic acid-binding protein
MVVLDASAAAAGFLGNPQLIAHIEALAPGTPISAPSLYIHEITNAFWKYHCFEKKSVEFCQEGIDYCLALPDEFIKAEELYQEAFALACSARHTAYDMFYLVLARRKNAALLTADRTLYKLCKKYGVKVLFPSA